MYQFGCLAKNDEFECSLYFDKCLFQREKTEAFLHQNYSRAEFSALYNVIVLHIRRGLIVFEQLLSCFKNSNMINGTGNKFEYSKLIYFID